MDMRIRMKALEVAYGLEGSLDTIFLHPTVFSYVFLLILNFVPSFGNRALNFSAFIC